MRELIGGLRSCDRGIESDEPSLLRTLHNGMAFEISMSLHDSSLRRYVLITQVVYDEPGKSRYYY